MNLFKWIRSGSMDRVSSLHQQQPEGRLRLLNLTRNTVLASSLRVAETASARSKGLLGLKCLPPGEGLWIIPCESIHTFWMQFSIDLVYLDRKKRIRKLVSDIPPWRLSACLMAHSVIELPAGTIQRSLTLPGDALEFSPGAASGPDSSLIA